MCLGAQAKAANERARKDYEYKLEKRERNWMQTLSMTRVEHLQYEQGIDATNLGLANTYSEIQAKQYDNINKAMSESQEDWKTFLAENTGDQLKAKGVTGRSSERISAINLGQYLKKGSDQVYALTQGAEELSKAGQKAAGMAKAQQMEAFTRVAFVKNPDMAPPTPVYQNVGHAAFMDALNIGMTVASPFIIAGSDRRLKENIVKLGESISGLGIYKFNYIGKVKQYIGTMADEAIKVVPEAVVTMSNGYLGVNYNLIDVNFKEVNS